MTLYLFIGRWISFIHKHFQTDIEYVSWYTIYREKKSGFYFYFDLISRSKKKRALKITLDLYTVQRFHWMSLNNVFSLRLQRYEIFMRFSFLCLQICPTDKTNQINWTPHAEPCIRSIKTISVNKVASECNVEEMTSQAVYCVSLQLSEYTYELTFFLSFCALVAPPMEIDLKI